MKQIAIFMGTRPEGIKMAPVVKAIEAAEGLEPLVVSTGQHKEMLQQVVDPVSYTHLTLPTKA